MLLALCLSSACSPRLLSPRSPLSPSAVSPPPAPLLLIDFPVPSTLLIFFSRIIVFNHRTIPFGLSSHRPALSIFRRLRSPSGRGELSLLISFVVVCFTVPLILSLSPFFPLPTNLDDFLCCSTSFSCQSPRFSVYLLPTYCTPPLPAVFHYYSLPALLLGSPHPRLLPAQFSPSLSASLSFLSCHFHSLDLQTTRNSLFCCSAPFSTALSSCQMVLSRRGSDHLDCYRSPRLDSSLPFPHFVDFLLSVNPRVVRSLCFVPCILSFNLSIIIHLLDS